MFLKQLSSIGDVTVQGECPMTIQKVVPLGSNQDAAAKQAPPAEALFDLTDLLRMVQARKEIIIGTAVTVITLTIIYLFQTTPLFTAHSVVLLDQRENKVLDVSAVIAGLPSDPTTIQNQVEILRSRNLAGRVADKLHFDDNLEFGGGPLGKPKHTILHWINPLTWIGATAPLPTEEEMRAERRDNEINSVLGAERVTVDGDSTAISIDVSSSSQALAASLANAIADAYVEDQLNAKYEATQKTSQWLADRLQQLSGQVQVAEAAVQQYKADHNINETSNGASIVQDQLGQLNGQLVLARSDLAEQEAKYGRVLALQSSGHADNVSQVVASPLIEQLRQQETDLLRQEAELNAKYGPKHPKILDLEAQKQNLQAKIGDEVQRVIQTVANDVAVARAHVASLQGSLGQLEGATSDQNRAEVKLKQLESTATSTRSLYEAFLSRFKEAQGQEGITTPDARVISRAVIPRSPSYPNKEYTLGIAVPAGLFLGILLAMVAERLDAGFRTSVQLERMIGLPVLSALPEVASLEAGERPGDLIMSKPLGGYAEAVRGLRLGLAQSNVDRRVKTLLVTSSVPEEGKSTVSLSIARLAAKSGQSVVVVDADLRHPSIAKALSTEKIEKGIIEVLTGEARLEDAFVKDPKSSALILASSKPAVNPPDLLGSETMAHLIGRLSENFDLVVIDSAPLLPVHDARLLAPLANSVLLVVRWEKTPRDAVGVAARTLADTQANVAGIVLTRADSSRYKYYAFGYQDYSSYHKYYND
jgi:capsular exopolysaccharide synthesis family protein